MSIRLQVDTPDDAIPAPARERPTHVRVTWPYCQTILSTGKVYEVTTWLDDYPQVVANDGSRHLLVLSKWQPAPAPAQQPAPHSQPVEDALHDFARTAGFTMPPPARPGLPDEVVALLTRYHAAEVKHASIWPISAAQFWRHQNEAKRIRTELADKGHDVSALIAAAGEVG